MRHKLPCYNCGRITNKINTQIHAGVRDLRAQLCVACHAQVDARNRVAHAFIAGEFGDDARIAWYHELPEGGVQTFKADRARNKANARLLVRFVADLPA